MNDLSPRIYQILSAAWRRRYALVLPVLLLPLAGLLTSAVSDKVYRSHTSMLIQETAKMNPFLQDFAVSALLKERMATLSTLLHSRHILAIVAEQRGLIDDDTPPRTRDHVIRELSDALSVSMQGKDLIRIDYRSDRPDGMKETLQSVSNQFIEQLLAPERSSMKDSATFLQDQLEQRRRDIEKAEFELAEFKDRYAAELPELHSSNVTRLAQLKQNLSEKQAELAGAQRSLGSLDAQLSRTNPVIGRLEEQIVSLNGDLALLRARYTDRHSKVQAILRKLHSLEAERQQTLALKQADLDSARLWQIASNTPGSNEGKNQPLLVSQLENLQLSRARVESLEEEIRSMRTMIDELERKSSTYGALESRLTKLQRDLKVKRGLYDELLNRYEMARITGSLSVFEQSKRVKIIDEPFTPVTAANLPALYFMLAGLLGGVILGIGLALLLEITDNGIRYREQLARATGIAVLGSISPCPEITP